MNNEEILLSHPHDFFRYRHLTTVPDSCFVLIPFKDKFRIVYETIASALEGIMECSRADDMRYAKPILERILRGICSSELIIADLTDKNANVFYELGLAHTRTKNVLLLTQNIDEIPFDLQNLFCHQYSLNSNKDLEELRNVVRSAASAIKSKSVPSMLKDSTTRTKQVVEYMEQYLISSEKTSDLIIRIQAGFSSLSNIGYWDSKDEEKIEYGRWLEKERDIIIKLIEKGAILQAIIYPPLGPWKTGRWRKRYDKLIEFLTVRGDLFSRVEFVYSIEEGSNLLFLNEDILFEGHKTGIEGGYGWTMVYTNKEYLLSRLTIFDMLFQSARRHTIKRYGNKNSAEGDKKALKEAVLNAITMARDGKSPPRWIGGK